MRSDIPISIIGSGGMLHSCVEIAIRTPGVVVQRVFLKEDTRNTERHVIKFLADRNTPCLTYKDLRRSTDRLLHGLDVGGMLVSVYNEDKLEADFLNRFTCAVNFHDAPLPKYAGRNAVSWALLCGERQHGVTWHEITPIFDAGDILAQELFPIESSWTALDLAVNSAAVGCRLFEKLLVEYTQGTVSRSAQDLRDRTYFNRQEIPFGGYFPFMASIEQIDRLRRATAYFPMPNRFCTPAVTVGNTTIGLVRFSVHHGLSNPEPGTVMGHDTLGVSFSTLDAIMMAEVVTIADGKPLRATHPSIREALKVGCRADIDRSAYDAVGLPLPRTL